MALLWWEQCRIWPLRISHSWNSVYSNEHSHQFLNNRPPTFHSRLSWYFKSYLSAFSDFHQSCLHPFICYSFTFAFCFLLFFFLLFLKRRPSGFHLMSKYNNSLHWFINMFQDWWHQCNNPSHAKLMKVYLHHLLFD